jgi:hypothetical protein
MNTMASERTGFSRLSKQISPACTRRLGKRCAVGIYSSCHDRRIIF